jgi:hypothetical protein
MLNKLLLHYLGTSKNGGKAWLHGARNANLYNSFSHKSEHLIVNRLKTFQGV